MEHYIEQISSMKYRVLNGFVSPHKAIMLLAVIDMIEFGLVEGNNFFIDDETKQSFLFNWEQYLGERKLPYKANPWAPFWHLKHEPFWHLIPIAGEEEKVKGLAGPGETPTVGKMRSVIAYAKIDDELYELLKESEFRDKAKQILVEKYINLEPQSKVTQQCQESQFAESDIILMHPIDYSVFEHGLTIESKYHGAVFDSFDRFIEKGRSVDITLNYKGVLFQAKLRNVNITGRKGNTLQILHKKSNSLGGYLKDELKDVYEYLANFKEKNGSRAKCILPSKLLYMMLVAKSKTASEFDVRVVAPH